MTITFLGTGTSSGVPVLTCDCEVCTSVDFRDKRLRVSVLIEVNNKSILIDAGPDFRQQALRERIKTIDAILLTHEHKDHTGGLDDIRPYNYFRKSPKQIRVLARKQVLEQLKKEYHYAFDNPTYPGLPLIELHQIENKPFEIEGIEVQPIEVMHHKLAIFGFRIHDFTYITDANYITETELEKLKGTKILVLNALRKEKHISHYNLEEALELIEKIAPQQAYLTHLSHQMGRHAEVEATLPKNAKIAFDGLKISV